MGKPVVCAERVFLPAAPLVSMPILIFILILIFLLEDENSIVKTKKGSP